MAVSETFDVGDNVSVAITDEYDLNDTKGISFYVLKASKAGETTVTLIYDGTLSGSSTVYDEAIPGEHDATSELEQAAIWTKIQTATTNWNSDNIRLLDESDLASLSIVKNAAGTYEIGEKYSFLAPTKLDGLPDATHYNYWTMIEDTSAATTSMYCVTLNENRTNENDAVATLQSNDITSTTNNTKCAIKPVIVIDKKYILCNNTKTPPTTTPTTTPTNVKTGVEDYILPFMSIIIVSAIAVVLTKNKSVFKNI